ncbi:ABC transporter substrate-binding protein [Thalassovita taeanensis]|uniref:ABC-type branched-chain amino acid transport system, substrate-binding protein n=1 Tax=Thalassovita taeanensis TaxID=657014 RepID=A0A1H9HAV7_9RHOB|nr:ABC transporter substrate-binding protein [Thalassovita taeanensis]SEQ59465.1 ABC-type branched-chain amino acid transport system, substrate-binding protein [Thalassovita taeanensis]
MNIKSLPTTLGLVAGLLLGTATGALAEQQGITDTEILIGEVLPVSGPPALLGFAHTLGVKAAAAEINAAGGINGRMIRIIVEDDGYVNSRTVEGVRKLLTVHKVFALTSLSGAAQGLTVLPLVRDSGIPAISPIGIAEELHTPLVPNIFVVGSTYDAASEAIVRELSALNPGKSWGIIVQDDEYGSLTHQGFDRALADLKFDVAYDDKYTRGQRDFSSEMLRLQASGAELFMMGGIIAENVGMAKELERLGYDIPLGSSFVGRVPAILKLMGDAGSNLYATDYVVPEQSEKGIAFLEKLSGFLTEDEMAATNRYTFTGYIAARAMFEAISRCGAEPTWDCTIEKLEGLTDFETGISSPVSFSADDHFARLELGLMKANVDVLAFEPVK